MTHLVGPRITAIAIAAAGVGLALIAGCANPERSRDLANPSVAAVTLAQQVCSNCHGLSGNSTSPNFPNLAAQPATYLQSQLREFRGHQRQDPAGFEYMWGLSRHLTDAQIEGLADYYSKQKLRTSPGVTNAQQQPEGQAIFEHGMPDRQVPACSGCHGARGEGNGQFPRLAGQHADYLIKQLGVFQRTDQRPNGAVMRVVAHGLDAQAMASVAGYLQSLPAP